MGDVEDYQRAHEALLARGYGRMVPDLDRITHLLGLLGDPQLAYPSIHVTGTNGKTSVTRMVATLCAASGIAAGAFTSPHLQSVRERIQVTGRPIPPSQFARVHDELAPLLELVDAAHPDPVTYFEATVAMGMWWFAEVPVDVAVVEVGMGGTWDATNLVRGDVAVFTPVDVDHSQLGDTAEVVVREKAGIIKQLDSGEPARVVTAQQQPAVLAHLREVAAARGAELAVAGEDFAASNRRVVVGGNLVDLRVGDRTITDVVVPLHGAHQVDNAALALAAFEALAGAAFANLDDDVVRAAFLAVTVPGRLEPVAEAPIVVLDGAHNPHGATTMAATFREAFTFPRLVLVVAVLADKDAAAMLAALADPEQGVGAAHVVVTSTDGARSLPTDDLLVLAEAAFPDDVEVEVATGLAEALELARTEAGPDGGVLVTGSLVTVGAARDLLVPFVELEPSIVTDEQLEDERDYDVELEAMFDRVDAERGGALGLPASLDDPLGVLDD